MQCKKILIVILSCLSIALICLFIIPMQRTYKAQIDINAADMITYRTLMDTTHWQKWYSAQASQETFSTVFIVKPGNTKNHFEYDLNTGNESFKQGEIQIINSKRWNTQIKWTEKLIFKKNIIQKLKLLFHPSEFREPFLQHVVQLKKYIEHPENVFGGLTFERKDIPANKLLTLSDSVSINELDSHITLLHQRIIAAVPADYLKQSDVFLSQHEMLNDSVALLRVAVPVAEEMIADKPPFELLDMDEHAAVILQSTKDYKSINEDISVMYEWLKKNNTRPASSFWIEQKTTQIGSIKPSHIPLTIVQEIYTLD